MNLKGLCLAAAAGGAVGTVSLFAVPALAHHSFAIFDQSQVISLTGTVEEFEWINPHAWLHLTITDDDGNAAPWAFEGGSTSGLTRLGWAPDSLSPGDQITIGFRPLKDGSRGGQLMRVTLSNGQRLCSNRGCG